MKTKHIVISFFLLLCVFVPFDHSLRSATIPIDTVQLNPIFTYWQAGRGEAMSETFITNSETTCCVEARVTWDSSVYDSWPFSHTKSFWEVQGSHGFSVESSEKPGYVGAYAFRAKLNGDPDTEWVAHPQNGRANEPITLTIKFTGVYSAYDTKDCSYCSSACYKCSTTATKTLIQDEKDRIRQEYVDQTPGSRAELPVPSRSAFVPTLSSSGTDGWNTGHYGYMIDDGLKSKKAAWLSQVNGYRQDNSLTDFTDSDFIVTSAYRNPYHQRFHVGGSFHSRHLYGDALDVHTLDVDNNGGSPEQLEWNTNVLINGEPMTEAYAESKSNDGVKMQDAAVDAGARWTASWKHYSTHTHADWTLRDSSWAPPGGTVYSPPCHFSSSTTETGGTTPTTPSMHACNLHPVSASGSHTSYTCNISPCSGLIWWGCVYAQCPQTSNHGKVVCTIQNCQDSTPYNLNDVAAAALHAYCNECVQYKCNGSDHTVQASCSDASHVNTNGDSCTVAGYGCVSHTPVYPAFACGVHTGDASLSSLHLRIASGTLAGYCTWHTFYQCSKSRHVSMTGGCGDTFYKCQENVRGHYRLSCWHRKHNGDRCRFRYWKCQNPSGIPSHTHTF